MQGRPGVLKECRDRPRAEGPLVFPRGRLLVWATTVLRSSSLGLSMTLKSVGPIRLGRRRFWGCHRKSSELKRPLAELSCAFVGALGELQINVCNGTSGSVAELVTIKVCPAMRVRLEMAATTGE